MGLLKLLSPSYLVDKLVTFVLKIILAVLLRILYLVKGEDVRVNREVILEKPNSNKPKKAKIPKKQKKTRDIPKAAEESETVKLVKGTPSELKPEENVGEKVVPKSQEKEEMDYPPFEMKTAHGITRESDMIPIEFHWKYGGNRVFVTGDFDDWKAQEHEMHLDPKTNDFVAVVEIDRTKQHEFKFVVDGNWQCNWDFPTRNDEHGNVNNILYPNPVGPLNPEYKEYVITSFNSPMTATAY